MNGAECARAGGGRSAAPYDEVKAAVPLGKRTSCPEDCVGDVTGCYNMAL